MLIRDATSEDWPLIWLFLHQVVAAGDTFAYDPYTGGAEAQAMWRVDAPGRVDVVAEGADVAGTANIHVNRSGPGAHVASVSYIVDLARRGQGVGRALVIDSLQWAQNSGFRGVQFPAVAQTNAHAIGLYEQLGFTVIGTVPGGFHHPLHGYAGLHVMFCPL